MVTIRILSRSQILKATIMFLIRRVLKPRGNGTGGVTTREWSNHKLFSSGLPFWAHRKLDYSWSRPSFTRCETYVKLCICVLFEAIPQQTPEGGRHIQLTLLTSTSTGVLYSWYALYIPLWTIRVLRFIDISLYLYSGILHIPCWSQNKWVMF